MQQQSSSTIQAFTEADSDIFDFSLYPPYGFLLHKIPMYFIPVFERGESILTGKLLSPWQSSSCTSKTRPAGVAVRSYGSGAVLPSHVTAVSGHVHCDPNQLQHYYHHLEPGHPLLPCPSLLKASSAANRKTDVSAKPPVNGRVQIDRNLPLW